MTHALLKGALPIYARMLAESCGVQVEFGHAIPKTDGITIFLPDLPVEFQAEAVQELEAREHSMMCSCQLSRALRNSIFRSTTAGVT